MLGPRDVSPRWTGWVVAALLLGCIVWDLVPLPARARLAASLLNEPLVERGRRVLEAAGHADVAAGWAWVVTYERALPPDARIYLDVPDLILYYFGNSFWYPRPLRVSTAPALVRDLPSLEAAFTFVAQKRIGALRAAGYTHIVVPSRDGIQLVDLRGRPPAGG